MWLANASAVGRRGPLATFHERTQLTSLPRPRERHFTPAISRQLPHRAASDAFGSAVFGAPPKKPQQHDHPRQVLHVREGDREQV